MAHQGLIAVLRARAGGEDDGGERSRPVRLRERAGEHDRFGAAGDRDRELLVGQGPPRLLGTWRHRRRMVGARQLERHGSVVLREHADQAIALEVRGVARVDAWDGEDDGVTGHAHRVDRKTGGVLVRAVGRRCPAGGRALDVQDDGQADFKRSLPASRRRVAALAARLPHEIQRARLAMLSPGPFECAVGHPCHVSPVNLRQRHLERVALHRHRPSGDVARALIRLSIFAVHPEPVCSM